MNVIKEEKMNVIMKLDGAETETVDGKKYYMSVEPQRQIGGYYDYWVRITDENGRCFDEVVDGIEQLDDLLTERQGKSEAIYEFQCYLIDHKEELQ